MSEFKLKDKVIVISGGTSGVGKAAAEKFAEEGAKVVISGKDSIENAQKVLDKIHSYGREGIFVYTDLNEIKYCKILFDEAFKKFGKIDGFFNYAGITPVSPLDKCNETLFDEIMDINFKSCFFCCQEAIKYMRKNNGGSIVITGSAHAWGGQKDRCVYACSKGVQKVLMEHIAHNYASEQIRCNYLTLGWTPTEGEIEFRKKQGESEIDLRKRAAKILPMGRMCEKSDYLEALVYLMSDSSSMMTGSVFRITAGEYI